MKHYRISIAEIRALTASDQALMIRALVEEPTYGGTKTFKTEDEYLDWKRSKNK